MLSSRRVALHFSILVALAIPLRLWCVPCCLLVLGIHPLPEVHVRFFCVSPRKSFLYARFTLLKYVQTV